MAYTAVALGAPRLLAKELAPQESPEKDTENQFL